MFGLDGSEKELTRYLFDDALHVAERPPARPGVAVSGVGVEGLGLRVRGLAALLHVCGRGLRAEEHSSFYAADESLDF